MEAPQIIDSGMDEQLEALAHPTRRRLLLALYRKRAVGEGAVTNVEELQAETSVSLHHTHLPKLREMGYIRYDEAEAEIEPGARFGNLEWLLRAIVEEKTTAKPA